jgi:D-serine deaminase-like pyridoxal phosphate-dependent protein
MKTQQTYRYYKGIFAGYDPPYAFVDLDAYRHNLEQTRLRAKGKAIRIASKSIRCRHLMLEALGYNAQYQGIMSYTGPETLHLLEHGFDDILIGYPIVDEASIGRIAEYVKLGRQVVFMVDRPEHLAVIDRVGKTEGARLEICFDVDGSSDLPGLYFGVRRSSLSNVQDVVALADKLKAHPNLLLAGIMIYEAQIAGLPDALPDEPIMNTVKRYLKRISAREVAKRRAAVVKALADRGYSLRLVNGGGTGSLESTASEDVITEVTAGSAFMAPGVFDYYKNFNLKKAAAYAIQITRRPKDGFYTCAGGGFTSSGVPGWDKAPKPWLPEGGRLQPREGAGEVQTPIEYSGPEELAIGDPWFMRHAKAGEICERFLRLHLVSEGKIMDTVPTYRGDGGCYI